MSPCEMKPDVPVYVAKDFNKLLNAVPTTETMLIDSDVYILPVGLPVTWYVHVSACKTSSETVFRSRRTSSGENEEIFVICSENSPIYAQVGTSEIKVDHVSYTAVDPV